MENYKTIKVFKKRHSTISEVESEGKKFIQKIYDNKKNILVEREHKTINEINKLLDKKKLSNHKYKSIEYNKKENAIIIEKIEGKPLNKYILGKIKDKEDLLHQFGTLGKIFRIVQENYKDKKTLGNLRKEIKKEKIKVSNKILSQIESDYFFYNRKIFAAATENFIISKKGIVPIDLGSRSENTNNLIQTARFLNTLYLGGLKPTTIIQYNWRYIKNLEEEFNKGYFGKSNIYLTTLMNIYRIISLRKIKEPLFKRKRPLRTLYLNIACGYEIKRLKRKINLKRILKEELKQLTKDLGAELNWSFYKDDILWPHVCEDIDLVFSEKETKVTKTLENKGYKKISSNMFKKYNNTYHAHYEYETHTKINGKDIGFRILKKRKLRKGIWVPNFFWRHFTRFIYLVQRPRGWLSKQIKRIKYTK
ncbi:hypothetical protein K9M74_00940 [Candidatus Woesearchaeota archaeon]|nr:hypothetical protein [Candidatus Woesearchaeota archaeon]